MVLRAVLKGDEGGYETGMTLRREISFTRADVANVMGCRLKEIVEDKVTSVRDHAACFVEGIDV